MEQETDLKDKPVLAMYDVRGIQNYIYRTSKVKDARGASAIVNEIIGDALIDAVKKEGEKSFDIEWFDEKGVKVLTSENDYKDIQVLFIGGGNATVLYRTGELCVRINRRMSKYVLENTYSLQLAIAVTEKTSSYSEDYRDLNRKMVMTKAKMSESKPLGTLPIMDMELKTGYPIEAVEIINGQQERMSRETRLKKSKADIINHSGDNGKIELRFEKYQTKKGIDSNLAVVHIDGNNMGLRIRGLIQGETDYITAVNKMRHISYNINNSYQSVFNDMAQYFNENSEIKIKKDNNFVLKILVAGDDITYICNAKIAMDTVEYYCKKIAKCTMNNNIDGNDLSEASIQKYGFSVCAGIAYFTSHFPFNIAYNVAEECCDSAKKYAKEHASGDRVANFFDFQICKNIQTENVELVRKNEYITSVDEQLLLRPYYVSIPNIEAYEVYEKIIPDNKKYSSLKKNIRFFQNEDNIPRSFAKELRNIYSDGRQAVNVFASFLKSRGWRMPDGTVDMYEDNSSSITAKWYDALELMDYYEEVAVDE